MENIEDTVTSDGFKIKRNRVSMAELQPAGMAPPMPQQQIPSQPMQPSVNTGVPSSEPLQPTPVVVAEAGTPVPDGTVVDTSSNSGIPDLTPPMEQSKTSLDRLNEIRVANGLAPLEGLPEDKAEEAVKSVEAVKDESEEEFDESKPIGKADSKTKWENLSQANKSKKLIIKDLEAELAARDAWRAELEANELKELAELREKSAKSAAVLEKLEFIGSEPYQELYVQPLDRISEEVGQYMNEYKVSDKVIEKIANGNLSLKERERLLSEAFPNAAAAYRVGQLVDEYKTIEAAKLEADKAPVYAQEVLLQEIKQRNLNLRAKNKDKVQVIKTKAVTDAIQHYGSWEVTAPLVKGQGDKIAAKATQIVDHVVNSADYTNPEWISYIGKLATSSVCAPSLGAALAEANQVIKGLEATIQEMRGFSSNPSRGRSVSVGAPAPSGISLSKMPVEQRIAFMHKPHNQK